ncbi:hypothetical protein Kpol_191p1 [Vanderwaltozyma polyspora DSM 70294]|uniref:Uncharacterized protein n=1 Tax=Vanderwaltozyma polyspora (strain ATCC 22028 / DSM 70294 / BCRC 21397 / CBS 2163 / NBRC 10782 / NRRL Y-8283 / UCD 57-17) TaxID=436907 RepID=A7TTL2_VANPO|nr:uncharacterized protein Kpol_191p1 [Vanderwaltozyma polyspora DSM 70294]EDO14392.1 hypothetical protein Kpol_191p1 [Vanderwaltozyma polyspora DSM 70294]
MLRILNESEKSALKQTSEGSMNGIIFSVKISKKCEDNLSDDATLHTTGESGNLQLLLLKSLKLLIPKYKELCTTVDENLHFVHLDEVKTTDVVKIINYSRRKFDINEGLSGPSSSLINSIYYHSNFQPGSGKPYGKLPC